METVIQYAAHFKPIILPTFKKNKLDLSVTKVTEQAIPESSYSFSVIENHREYVQQQTKLFEYLLQKQEIVWQQYVALYVPNNHSKQNQGSLPPQFSRQDLEGLASGTISNYFGEWFKPLDQYERLIRMPEPPLLLADRVIKIKAEPASLKTGSIWTATDIKEEAWYLFQGRMPAGIMIEAGQAD